MKTRSKTVYTVAGSLALVTALGGAVVAWGEPGHLNTQFGAKGRVEVTLAGATQDEARQAHECR